ncbi:MAG: hypothetical protein K8T89_18130 [Planctomycetes bacterium]|nr:hypothetical protein [Planctomycetota bacterium]
MKTGIRSAAVGAFLALVIGGTAAAEPKPTLKEEASCGDYGTSVRFEDTPVEAAKVAKKDGKLVMVLHISGHFEDPGLT